MSVYTSITRKQLESFLTQYSVGSLIKFSGIEAGVENTNYFVSTTQGEYVLTIYEDFNEDELPFFLDLMQHLSNQGIATVSPVKNNQNQLISKLCNKPTALVNRLAGANVMAPSIEHCAAIGKALAEIHLAGLSYPAKGCREDHRFTRLTEAESKGSELFTQLSDEDKHLLQQELDHYKQFDFSLLPQGIVHSDLFRDNCIFEEHSSLSNEVKISGIIDLYCACQDALLYDLAVTVNDWCFSIDRKLDVDKYEALVKAYHSVRPLTNLEKEHWFSILRIAVLYFWVFRILFNLNPPEGETVASKDVQEFTGKMIWYRKNRKLIEEITSRICQ